jgi:hypothetical protein
MPSNNSLLSSAARLRFGLMRAALVALLAFQMTAPAMAQYAGTAAVEEIATAGPFFLTSRRMQRFSAQFKLSPEDLAKPLTLVLHNGLGDRPGLNWIRVLHGPDLNLNGLRGAEEPSADLLYDENYVELRTIEIDLSDKCFAGINTIILEGTGPKNGVISWVIEGPPAPEFASINPTAAQSGGRLTLSGRGFSVDPNENRVTVNGHETQVIAATRTSLTVKLPGHISAGQAQVVVTTNNVRSAPYAISIVDAAP